MAQNVTSIWNDEAANYNFSTTTSAGPATTFGDAYSGAAFAISFQEILTAVDAIARPDGTTTPGYDGNDPMLESLENYPDNP